MLKDKIIVYTSGTFDLFHSNHLKMINYARGLGDILIVGVSTDELVVTYKDPPIIPFEERISIIEGLKAPNLVIPQKTLDHSDLVKQLHFDVFVVGDDWVGKYDYLNELNVKVFYFPYGDGISTTNVKEKISKKYNQLKTRVDKHLNPNVKKG